MSSGSQAGIEAAVAYEEEFVPALFQPWTDVLLDAAKVTRGHRVLDVACGTGVLARDAAARAGSDGSVVGLDPDDGMLTVAERLSPDIDWRQGMAELLPWADESFDIVLSQFGLMLFTDRRQALREMWRVVVPRGRLAIAVWGSVESMPPYQAELELLQRVAGGEAAAAVRAPFALGHLVDLKALFASAGIPYPAITTHKRTARFPSVRAMVEADVRGWLPIMGVVLPDAQVERILSEAETAITPHVILRDGIMFETTAHVMAVTKE